MLMIPKGGFSIRVFVLRLLSAIVSLLTIAKMGGFITKGSRPFYRIFSTKGVSVAIPRFSRDLVVLKVSQGVGSTNVVPNSDGLATRVGLR